MKKLICLFSAALFAISIASAQDYNQSAGIRVGGEMIGASVKHSLDGVNAIEGFFSVPWDDGFIFTALYERHVPVISDGFHLYYGGGFHIGSWKHKFAVGIDGIVGLEYKIKEAPLAFSVDYKPIFNIASKTKFYMADIALGVKVTF